jgi:TolB-like protein/Tfp pilus assembly protein PilF
VGSRSLSPDSVRFYLGKILASRSFSAAEGRSRFLRFIVEQTLQNRQDELKEYVIGVEAFARGESFDPKSDSIVRVEARKLRSKLGEYYQHEGRTDSVRIILPKGAYVPLFQEMPHVGLRRIWIWCAAAGVAAILLIAAKLLYRGPEKSRADHGVESIVVLPLANLGLETENQYFSDGLTAELIATLMKRGRPRVVGSTSVFQLKGEQLDIRRVGRELGADAVLKGSVRRSGNRLTITAEVIEVSGGRQLWSQTYDRDWKDVLDVQEDIADDVVAALEVTPRRNLQRARNQCSENLPAYELYLRGTRAEVARGTEDMTRSLEYFSQAAALEPRCAPVYARLAILYMRQGLFGIKPPWDAMPKAKQAARKAIEIDETLALGHVALGAVTALYDWDWKSAERELQRAIELNPESIEIHQWFAYYVLAPQRRFEEALSHIQEAKWLDPLSPLPAAAESEVLYFAGQYDAAIAQARQLIERQPNFGFGYLYLAWSLEQKRLFSEANEALAKAMSLDKCNVLPELEMAVLDGMQGRTERARKALREFETRSKTSYVPAPVFAHIYSILGEKENAFMWLGRGLKERSPMLAYLSVARDYDNLRGDLRFDLFLRDVHLK